MPLKRTKGFQSATRQRKPTYVYVPETFDPKKDLPVDLQRYSDCARYLLHRIIWGRVMKKMTAEQFVPVKFDYLREAIPDRAIKPLKQALLDSGVIETDGHYVEGKKAIGYRLCDPHKTARIVRIPLEDQETAKKVRTNRNAEFKKVRLDVHRYLLKWYKQLEIDLTLAKQLLKGDPNIEVNILPAQQIAAKDYSFSVCRYGRVHTDLTRCSKQLRPALSVKGEQLVEIDIANSQPLFLGLLLINYRKNHDNLFGHISYEKDKTDPYKQIEAIIQGSTFCFEQKENNLSPPLPSASITTRRGKEEVPYVALDKGLMTTDNWNMEESVIKQVLKPDEVSYIRLCETGRLYDYFVDGDRFSNRKQVKQGMFKLMYGKNRSQSPLKRAFTEAFPSVAEFIMKLKSKDYTFLPRLLQNVESNFVINSMCRKLMQAFPKVPVFTIHDCILTIKSHSEAVMNLIQKEFNHYGMSTKLHVHALE